jgi:hypothetical protein
MVLAEMNTRIREPFPITLVVVERVLQHAEGDDLERLFMFLILRSFSQRQSEQIARPEFYFVAE